MNYLKRHTSPSKPGFFYSIPKIYTIKPEIKPGKIYTIKYIETILLPILIFNIYKIIPFFL